MYSRGACQVHARYIICVLIRTPCTVHVRYVCVGCTCTHPCKLTGSFSVRVYLICPPVCRSMRHGQERRGRPRFVRPAPAHAWRQQGRQRTVRDPEDIDARCVLPFLKYFVHAACTCTQPVFTWYMAGVTSVHAYRTLTQESETKYAGHSCCEYTMGYIYIYTQNE